MQRLEDLQMEYAMSKSHGMIAIENFGTQRMSKSAKGTAGATVPNALKDENPDKNSPL